MKTIQKFLSTGRHSRDFEILIRPLGYEQKTVGRSDENPLPLSLGFLFILKDSIFINIFLCILLNLNLIVKMTDFSWGVLCFH